jgi:hypothetical protein
VIKRHRELWYTLIAVVVVTALYALAYLQAGRFPAASGLVGHGIGIVGFILMLMTETLYSLRKRSTDARWGRMSDWLTFHMVTGLVGPYMVLLHTTMKFNGVAGVALLLTVVVVASGLVGRYLYTAIPRVVDEPGPVADRPEAGDDGSADAAPSAQAISPERLSERRVALARWYSVHIPLTWTLFAFAFIHAGAALYYATLQR